jgi:hypothetical protein
MVLGLGTFTFASAPELVADVQAWLNDPNSNQGWILMSQSEGIPRTARRIAAREANASDRPRLVVEFSVPPIGPPAELQSPQRLGDAFSFTFTAEANRAYAVEFAEALPVSTWQPLTNITAQAEVQEITVSDGSVTSSLHRFYRVRTQ